MRRLERYEFEAKVKEFEIDVEELEFKV